MTFTPPQDATLQLERFTRGRAKFSVSYREANRICGIPWLFRREGEARRFARETASMNGIPLVDNTIEEENSD